MIQHSDQREYTMLISQNYSTTKQLKFCTREPTSPPQDTWNKITSMYQEPNQRCKSTFAMFGIKKVQPEYE